jgi:hypothetical protein
MPQVRNAKPAGGNRSYGETSARNPFAAIGERRRISLLERFISRSACAMSADHAQPRAAMARGFHDACPVAGREETIAEMDALDRSAIP